MEKKITKLLKLAIKNGFDFNIWINKYGGGILSSSRKIPFFISCEKLWVYLLEDFTFIKCLFGDQLIIVDNKKFEVWKYVYTSIHDTKDITDKVNIIYDLYNELVKYIKMRFV